MKIENITKTELEDTLNQFERFANTYFWTPPASASARRGEEQRNSSKWEFLVDGKPVICSVSISCSCKNYYSTRKILVDGQPKKMMVPFLKKLISEFGKGE